MSDPSPGNMVLRCNARCRTDTWLMCNSKFVDRRHMPSGRILVNSVDLGHVSGDHMSLSLPMCICVFLARCAPSACLMRSSSGVASATCFIRAMQQPMQIFGLCKGPLPPAAWSCYNNMMCYVSVIPGRDLAPVAPQRPEHVVDFGFLGDVAISQRVAHAASPGRATADGVSSSAAPRRRARVTKR